MVGVVMTQMIAKKGTETYGDRARGAIVTEYKQLDDLNIWEGMETSSISQQQRKDSF